MEHTPEPWVIDRSFQYAINAGDKHIAMINCMGLEPAEAEANARLIAAAPDLLVALRALLTSNAIDRHSVGAEALWEAARTAIAKATEG